MPAVCSAELTVYNSNDSCILAVKGEWARLYVLAMTYKFCSARLALALDIECTLPVGRHWRARSSALCFLRFLSVYRLGVRDAALQLFSTTHRRRRGSNFLVLRLAVLGVAIVRLFSRVGAMLASRQTHQTSGFIVSVSVSITGAISFQYASTALSVNWFQTACQQLCRARGDGVCKRASLLRSAPEKAGNMYVLALGSFGAAATQGQLGSRGMLAHA